MDKPMIEILIKANEESLMRQSRSFATPILNLDHRFRNPIMVQYNLNKTIDTIEDSPSLETPEKIALIHTFCDHLHQDRFSSKVKSRMLAVTPMEEAFVFKNYEYTVDLYKTLSQDEKELGRKWTTEMAKGMCHFLIKSIHTLGDLNDYCYYVAGTVGLYLTNLLRLNGSHGSKESSKTLEENAVSFGLFLQKLNIIRDFVEDKDKKKRSFWPETYFNGEYDHVKILNKMCYETLKNDVPRAIEYYKNIPPGNDSYDYFIRFILSSGIEYLKILKNNRSVFSRVRVKLSKTFMKNLYRQVSAQSRKDFKDYCERFYVEEIGLYAGLI